MEIQQIDVNKIKPDPDQPRKFINYGKIDEIAESLKNTNTGIINPIEVDTNYMIITGEHRWRASVKAGLKTVPCKVFDPEDRFLRQFIENVHQGVMNDLDVANSLKRLLEEVSGGRTPSEDSHQPNDQGHRLLARKLGKPKSWVHDKLSILKEPEYVQEAVKEGKMTSRAIADSRRAPEQFRDRIKQKYIKGEIPTADAVREVSAALKRDPDKSLEIFDLDLKGLSVADTIEKVRKISPSRVEKAEKHFDHHLNSGDELVEAIKELKRQMEACPFPAVGGVNKMFVHGELKKLKHIIDNYFEVKETQAIEVPNRRKLNVS